MSSSESTLDLEPRSPSPPSSGSEGDSKSPSPQPNPGPYEWVRLTDIIFGGFQGVVPRSVSWSVGTLRILSFPVANATPPRSIWYVTLASKDSSGETWHTIDLIDRPWVVDAEEASLTFMFDFGHVEAGTGQRYFVKLGCHEAFCYLLSYVCYIKGCAVGAFVESRHQP